MEKQKQKNSSSLLTRKILNKISVFFLMVLGCIQMIWLKNYEVAIWIFTASFFMYVSFKQSEIINNLKELIDEFVGFTDILMKELIKTTKKINFKEDHE